MNYAQAKRIELPDIPVIDVAALSGGTDGIAGVARAMRSASENTGFFYIRNHGVPQALIDRVYDASRRFFAQPLAEKQKVRINARHRGFLKVGEAKMYDKARIDLKESYIWGLELGEDDPDVRAGRKLMGPNQWPADMPEFRAALTDYYEAMLACGNRLLLGMAASLDLPLDFFTSRFRKPLARGSLVYYPPQPPDMGSEQFGVAPHTDYGGITFVWQDQVGGLQVKGRSGEWVTAHPIPGTFVVNIGDLMARWTNDHFTSNPHRVINSSGRERYSIAVFFDPDYDTVVDPAEIFRGREAPRHPPITCGEYIVSRFDRAFAYRK
ncbi:MAG: isopenicillin N synthase family oxygenase [Alphaproteobacteria bacterium]|nr:isopenicillin N synthase family oxygenase [Alphaproteobacteria bacterium]